MIQKVSKSGKKNWRLNQIFYGCMILIVLLGSTCNGKSPVLEMPEDILRVLFVGNSLTSVNDVPGMLGRMLQNADIPVDKIESVSVGGFGLQDHWVTTKTRTAIATGDWDLVVLQQGPSATEGRPSLLEYSGLFAREIRAAGARPALYMVWPADSRSFDFDGVSDSYRTAAEQVDGLLFPAGEAWRAAWRRDSTIKLYGSDKFHPSLLGSYLAALVMFEQIARRDPHDLPAAILTSNGEVKISEALAKLLQDAAVEANAKFSR